jgi:hypothetical protein
MLSTTHYFGRLEQVFSPIGRGDTSPDRERIRRGVNRFIYQSRIGIDVRKNSNYLGLVCRINALELGIERDFLSVYYNRVFTA